MGLNFTTAFNIFARQCIAEQEIPFKTKAINIEEYFNNATIKAINKSIDEVDKGNTIVKTSKDHSFSFDYHIKSIYTAITLTVALIPHKSFRTVQANKVSPYANTP